MIRVNVRASSQTGGFAIRYTSEKDSVEKLVPIRNDAAGEILRVFLSYSSITEDGRYVERIITSIERVDLGVAIVISSLVENEKCGGHRKTE